MSDLPAATGVSKEATAMAVGCLTKTGYAVLEGPTAATREIRLEAKGQAVRARVPKIHERVEAAWNTRFGEEAVAALRASLGKVLEHPRFAEGLRPHADGWRASRPYLARTEALLASPREALPHHPLVLHRGGWPDGS
jgi:hypothetical protein